MSRWEEGKEGRERENKEVSIRGKRQLEYAAERGRKHVLNMTIMAIDFISLHFT